MHAVDRETSLAMDQDKHVAEAVEDMIVSPECPLPAQGDSRMRLHDKDNEGLNEWVGGEQEPKRKEREG